jgi:hypothetical protein
MARLSTMRGGRGGDGGEKRYSSCHYHGASSHLLKRQSLQISSAPLLVSSSSSSSSSSSFADVNQHPLVAARRSFSDQLLGYSPMSPKPIIKPSSQPSSSSPSTTTDDSTSSSSSSSTTNTIPTAEDVTTAGGIWAPTSAKRTKLGELMVEMTTSTTGQQQGGTTLRRAMTLDDMATDIEKLDLWLCDGLSAITKAADFIPAAGSRGAVERSRVAAEESLATDSSSTLVLEQLDIWLTEQKMKLTIADLHQIQWEEHLRNFTTVINQRLSTMPSDRYLRDIRDYLDIGQYEKSAETTTTTTTSLEKSTETTTPTTSLISTSELSNFEMAVVRYRLLMARAAAEMLMESWTMLTAVADQDIDRAAVQGQSVNAAKASTLPVDKLHAVLQSFFAGTASARVDALWDLRDHGDQDGLLNEEEMNQVCELAIRPVHKALEKLLDEALEASPVVVEMPSPPPQQATTTPAAKPPGWRQRQREKREKKRLQKMFAKTLKRHFTDEVEMPHRLRCIYAWANKAHQDNKIDSVMVDEAGGGWSGRQRYVELFPKISLDEFREVQKVHFTHLDRVGAEIIKSFREDLWVLQGKKRTNKELMRDCAMFLTAVCIVDYIIIIS